ncbi:MAG: PaaI family thioesterase [Terriglobales bacterium]
MTEQDIPGSSKAGSPQTAHPLVQKVLASKPPIADLIGFDIEEIGDGRAVGSLQTGPQHANPMGTLHGGVLCDLADAAMGMAFASTLAPGESFTTMTLNINFFRPVWQTRLRAEARVLNRGKNVGYIECEVSDQDGKQIAKVDSTCFVLRGDHAKQR